jgi:hypothetical protein
MATFINAAHALGNFFGFVTSAFKIRNDLADTKHQTKIGSCWLTFGDDVGAVVINGFFKLIDPAISLDNAFDTGDFTGGVGVNSCETWVSPNHPFAGRGCADG